MVSSESGAPVGEAAQSPVRYAKNRSIVAVRITERGLQSIRPTTSAAFVGCGAKRVLVAFFEKKMATGLADSSNPARRGCGLNASTSGLFCDG